MQWNSNTRISSFTPTYPNLQPTPTTTINTLSSSTECTVRYIWHYTVTFIFTFWFFARSILAVDADRVANPADSRSWRPRPRRQKRRPVAYDGSWWAPDAPDTAVPGSRRRWSEVRRRGICGRRRRASRVGPRAADTAARDSRNGPRHRDARHPVRVSTPAPFNDRRATDNRPPPPHNRHPRARARTRGNRFDPLRAASVALGFLSLSGGWNPPFGRRTEMPRRAPVHAAASPRPTFVPFLSWADKSGRLPGVKGHSWLLGETSREITLWYTCGLRCSNLCLSSWSLKTRKILVM